MEHIHLFSDPRWASYRFGFCFGISIVLILTVRIGHYPQRYRAAQETQPLQDGGADLLNMPDYIGLYSPLLPCKYNE